MQQVVITGIGVVAPHGTGMEKILESVRTQAPVFSPWPESQNPPHPSATIANVTDYPKNRFFSERQLRLMDRAMTMSSCAAGLALEDAGFELGAPADTGTFLGTSRGELPSVYNFMAPLLPGNSGRLNAADFPMMARNVACGQIAIRFGLRGQSTVLASGSIASIEAISRAVDFIQKGRTRVALAGGFEALSKFSLYFLRHHYGNTMTVDQPNFFGDRPGYLVPSEGACLLVLESLENARARKARIYGRIDGWYAGRFGVGNAANCLHDAWEALLQRVGSARGRIGMISAASGGSNRLHEVAEREAIAAFLDGRGARASVCAPRSFAGEGEAWTSALQVAVAASALAHNRSVPTWKVAAEAPREISTRIHSEALAGDAALVSGIDPSGAYCALHLSHA